jgi:hypothetical protein
MKDQMTLIYLRAEEKVIKKYLSDNHGLDGGYGIHSHA